MLAIAPTAGMTERLKANFLTLGPRHICNEQCDAMRLLSGITWRCPRIDGDMFGDRNVRDEHLLPTDSITITGWSRYRFDISDIGT
jgi:hypothetical protein